MAEEKKKKSKARLAIVGVVSLAVCLIALLYDPSGETVCPYLSSGAGFS